MLEAVPFYVWLLLGAMFLHGVAYVVVGTWWVASLKSSIRDDFRTEIKAERQEIDHSMGVLENETKQAITGLQNDTRQSVNALNNVLGGEINAVRESLHEHEKFTRDTFVRQGSFDLIIEQLISQIKDISTSINERLNRFDEKLDQIRR